MKVIDLYPGAERSGVIVSRNETSVVVYWNTGRETNLRAKRLKTYRPGAACTTGYFTGETGDLIEAMSKRTGPKAEAALAALNPKGA